MTIAYTPGCWDLLHIGHVLFLQKAATYADRLIVGVADNDVIKADKGKPPILNTTERLLMVQSVKGVSSAIPYRQLGFIAELDMLHPHVLAIGEQWGNDERHQQAEKWCANHGTIIVNIPYTRGISTTDIIQRAKQA